MSTSVTPNKGEGWKPETRYNTNVLVGNWLEERQNWENYHYPIMSTHRSEFRDFSSQRPDKLLRLKDKVRMEMGASNFLMKHSEQPAGAKSAGSNYPYLVTWYDEDYNRKERTESEKLPPLRRWDLHQIAWLPEKSDHPISYPPTNWGLTEDHNKKWQHELATEGKAPSFDTTYSTSYHDCDVHSTAEMRRFAVPRDLSVHFVPFNRSKLALRSQRSYVALQIPEPPLCNIAEQIRASHCRVQEQGRQLLEKVNAFSQQYDHPAPALATPPPCTR